MIKNNDIKNDEIKNNEIKHNDNNILNINNKIKEKEKIEDKKDETGIINCEDMNIDQINKCIKDKKNERLKNYEDLKIMIKKGEVKEKLDNKKKSIQELESLIKNLSKIKSEKTNELNKEGSIVQLLVMLNWNLFLMKIRQKK